MATPNSPSMDITPRDTKYRSKTIKYEIICNHELSNCTIKYAGLWNCHMINCRIENCRISLCILQDCETTDCSRDPLTTSTFSPFRKLAAEIRDIIFPEVLEWTGKTPNFLKAVRGDRVLYQQALHHFYKLNAFVLSGRNQGLLYEFKRSNMQTKSSFLRRMKDFYPMSNNALQTITKVSFEYEHPFCLYSSQANTSIRFRTLEFKHIPLSFSGAHNIQSLHIDFGSRVSKSSYFFETVLRDSLLFGKVWDICMSWITGLKTIKELSVTVPEAWNTLHTEYKTGVLQMVRYDVGMVDLFLGTKGRLASVASSGPSTWIWENEDGTALALLRSDTLAGFNTRFGRSLS
ncbi:hypothetical protein B7494_g3685 [Chlorociboria aeruginascens]|nr:hypothetical protein B7494_g3685 [Chlorociboria aeruginascens]